MAAATPPVVLSRLSEQAAMQLSCILEVFDLVISFVPVLDLEAIGKGEYVMGNASIQTMHSPDNGPTVVSFLRGPFGISEQNTCSSRRGTLARL